MSWRFEWTRLKALEWLNGVPSHSLKHQTAQDRSSRRGLGFQSAGGFYGQRLVEIIDDAGSRDFIAQFEIAGFEVFDKGFGADIGLDVLIGNALFFQAFPHHNHDMADMRIPGFFDIDKPQGDEQNTE